MSQPVYNRRLQVLYAWYTAGFILFILLLASAERLGMTQRAIGYVFMFATVALYAGIGMMNRRQLAVHHFRGMDVFATKGIADALVTKADAKQRYFALDGIDERNGDARVGRRPRPRRDNDLLRLQRERLFDGKFIVPVHRHLSPKLADVVKALNSIGATPADLIAILQAIKSAGALRAELEII